MTLETPALEIDDLPLRATSIGDTEAFAAMLTSNYERLSEWIDLPALIPDISNHRDAMQSEFERRKKRNERWWLIWDGEDLAGSISLLTPEGRANWGLIGYWLAESHTGRGIASRAVLRTQPAIQVAPRRYL